MKVLKFGGTSVGSCDNIRRLGDIVHGQSSDVIVVVSALGGVTDMLCRIADAAASNSAEEVKFSLIRSRHIDVIGGLFDSRDSAEVRQLLEPLFIELEKIVQGILLIGELTPKTLDKVMGFGERMSSVIVSRFLGVPLLDGAAMIRTDYSYGKANVDLPVTYELIRDCCSGLKGVMGVVPGFVSTCADGSMSTLGRGGSDYTAALFAAALNAERLEIWTDVDGFMTADPKVISKAYPIPFLTYSEAMELSHFGAKVIYPPTVLPVYQSDIPIHIKNTLNPDSKGTLINSLSPEGKDRLIKGISSISGISLVTVQGLGMIGVVGIAMRLFGALAKESINVILISQASSENSISFAIDSSYTGAAEDAIGTEFEREIRSGHINRITIEDDLSIVAIVGEGMKHYVGISGKLFQTIGKNGINVVAIAQGASEQNISWVVKLSDLRKTLNVVHESFFLSPFIELNIFLVGIGIVGRDLLKQIEHQQLKLKRKHRLKLRLVGAANSRKMVFDRRGLDIGRLSETLDNSEFESDMSVFREKVLELNMFNSVFVDCTANDDVALQYPAVMDGYVSVVAANKVAASSGYERYRQLKELAGRRGVKFFFETNVGAGLPLISTINDLRRSGDHIIKIEAVLSGTLNFIFNTLSSDVSFSHAVKMAKENGFSEPDPRIDLSGIDVVRKLVILARESGYKMEKKDVVVEPIVSQRYFDLSIDEFWEAIPEVDKGFEEQRVQLEKESKKWRFICQFESGKASVALRPVSPTHPFYDLEGSNNIVLLTSERYNEHPMQIKGYGAGAGVTAAGVFADIIRVANI